MVRNHTSNIIAIIAILLSICFGILAYKNNRDEVLTRHDEKIMMNSRKIDALMVEYKSDMKCLKEEMKTVGENLAAIRFYFEHVVLGNDVKNKREIIK